MRERKINESDHVSILPGDQLIFITGSDHTYFRAEVKVESVAKGKCKVRIHKILDKGESAEYYEGQVFIPDWENLRVQVM